MERRNGDESSFDKIQSLERRNGDAASFDNGAKDGAKGDILLFAAIVREKAGGPFFRRLQERQRKDGVFSRRAAVPPEHEA